MKYLFLVLAFSGLSFGDYPPNQDWRTLNCSQANVSNANYFVNYYTNAIREAQAFQSRCATNPYPNPNPNPYPNPGSGGDTCITYVTQRTNNPQAAANYCQGIDNDEFDCFRIVVEQLRGSWQYANQSCQGYTYQRSLCLKAYLAMNIGGNNYALNTCRALTDAEASCQASLIRSTRSTSQTADICRGVSWSQSQCIQNLVDQGQNPYQAKRACAGS